MENNTLPGHASTTDNHIEARCVEFRRSLITPARALAYDAEDNAGYAAIEVCIACALFRERDN